MKLTTKIVAVVFTILLAAFYLYARLNYIAMRDYHQSAIDDELNDAMINIVEWVNTSDELENYVFSKIDDKNIALTRALAEIIKNTPETLEPGEMARLAAVLGVDEVHVTDESGVLLWGNISDFYGFNFADADQTVPFLNILADKGYELAQDPEPRGINGEMFQYTGSSRTDGTGIVQVGVDAEYATDIDNILDVQHNISQLEIGDGGFAFIAQGGQYTAHKQQQEIGVDISGQSWYATMDAQADGFGWYTIDGEGYYVGHKKLDEKLIAVCLSETEFYAYLDQFRMNNILLAFLIGLFTVIVLWFTVDRLVIKPIVQLSGDLGYIARGELNVNTRNLTESTSLIGNFTAHSSDEIGLLATGISNISQVLNALITGMGKMAVEHSEGEIDARIDDSLYSGAYKEVAMGINTMVGSYVQHMSDICDALSEFGAGNFNVAYAQLPGKKALANNVIEALRKELKGINGEISALIDAAYVGELSRRADIGQYQGDWAGLLDKLNKLMYTIVTPISEATQVMQQVAAGNFDSKMEGDYKGDFLLIKNSINNTVSNIDSYIDEISRVLGEMSAQNLSVSIDRQYIGDFQLIKDSINKIISTFNDVLSNINASADQVAVGAKQISESGISLSQGAAEQASVVEELSAVVEQEAGETKKNAGIAHQASQLAREAKINAEKEAAMMHEMMTAMEAIDESSANISKIIKVIDGIAFQTNLLALNAAVEAARAGESGKGFAVVASEVRNLAGRSQAAARDTAALVEGSVQKATEGTRVAAETAKGLVAIVDQISEVANYIGTISESSKEQSVNISRINESVALVSQVTQANTAISEESAASSEELSSQAELFRNMVAKFRLK